VDPAEIACLSLILGQMRTDLEPLDGRHVLVLCTACRDIPFWLADRQTHGRITSLELSDELLDSSRKTLKEKSLGHCVEFREAGKTRIALPDDTGRSH